MRWISIGKIIFFGLDFGISIVMWKISLMIKLTFCTLGVLLGTCAEESCIFQQL